jgi:uncharacterized protein (TIGR02246 family)
MATEITTGGEIRDTIMRANEKWMDFYRRHDAAGIASLYTEDAEVLPPNSDFVRGKPAIAGLFQALFDMGIRMIELHTGEVEQHGDAAFEISTATLRGGSGEVLDNAKYIVIWNREGGIWKLHRDIFNSSTPAQA